MFGSCYTMLAVIAFNFKGFIIDGHKTKEDDGGIVNNGEQQRHHTDSNGSSENNDPNKEKRKNENLHDSNGSANGNGNNGNSGNGNSGNGNGNHHHRQPTYNGMNNPYQNAPHAMDAATAVMGVGGDRRPERPRSDSGQQLPEFQFLSSNHLGSGGKVCAPPNRSMNGRSEEKN